MEVRVVCPSLLAWLLPASKQKKGGLIRRSPEFDFFFFLRQGFHCVAPGWSNFWACEILPQPSE